MADYSDSKASLGANEPDNAIEAEGFNRNEPLLTAKALRRKYLFGVSLSVTVDGKKQTLDDEDLDEQILDAVATIEQEASVSVFPVVIDERLEFDRNEYMSCGYMRLRQRPVQSIESLTITTANEQQIYRIANEWIDSGYLGKGQLYIIPLNVQAATSVQGSNTSVGGAAFLSILGQLPWVPAYWRCRYTVGFPSGSLPRIVNQAIGCQAAIQVLTLMAQANAKSGSHSLGIDGLSQSSSNPGPDVYTKAIEAMTLRKSTILRKLKAQYGQRLFSSNV